MCIRDSLFTGKSETFEEPRGYIIEFRIFKAEKRIDVCISAVKKNITCLLYTSDAADERSSVDLGGRRIIKKKKE